MSHFRAIIIAFSAVGFLTSQPSPGAERHAIDDALASLLLNAPAETTGYDPRVTGIDAGQQALFDAYHENGLVALWVTEGVVVMMTLASKRSGTYYKTRGSECQNTTTGVRDRDATSASISRLANGSD